jgi:hypothetical protein
MSLRTLLNQNRAAKITLSICAVAAVAVVVGMQFRSADAVGDGKHIFITLDDGKTLVLHDADQLPPFEFQGKTAYQANVFTSDGKTRFVGFLQRYTPQGKRMMEETRKKNQGSSSQNNSRAMPSFNAALLDGIEIKRPGDKDWVKQSDTARANKILDVTCPNENRPADPVIP